MRAAIFAVVAVSTAIASVCACGETATPLPIADDGGNGGEGDGEARPSGDAGGGTPTGERAPTGCLLETTGLMVGSKAEATVRDGAPNAVAWTDATNARTDDGKFAAVTLADGQESATLRITGFGFAIPSTAETWGIAVELKRQAPQGGIEDLQINVEIDGKPSRFKHAIDPWPDDIVGTHEYGQAVDTWGVDLLPADVNNPTFATTITVQRAAGATGPVTAHVDSLKVAIHYCPVPIKN